MVNVCKAICTDDTAALTGSKKGFKVNDISPSIILLTNFIKSKTVNSRLFTIP